MSTDPTVPPKRGRGSTFTEWLSRLRRYNGPTDKLSVEQEDWLRDLRRAGVEAFVWRPEDWPTVVEVLK